MSKNLLAGIILMTALIWTVADILVFLFIGTEYTLSNSIHTWLGVGDAHTNRTFLAGFTAGFLSCHLFGWSNRPTKHQEK